MNPTEQAHTNLRNLLLSGQILLNGFPVAVNVMTAVIQGEQLLFEKATKFDQAELLAQKNKVPEKKKD